MFLDGERHINEICLWVLEKNIVVRNFYEKQGYVRDGTHKYIEPLNATEIRYTKKLIHGY